MQLHFQMYDLTPFSCRHEYLICTSIRHTIHIYQSSHQNFDSGGTNSNIFLSLFSFLIPEILGRLKPPQLFSLPPSNEGPVYEFSLLSVQLSENTVFARQLTSRPSNLVVDMAIQYLHSPETPHCPKLGGGGRVVQPMWK